MEIPPVKPSDAEDVAWGLQTAETLWKRGERIDAVVWLRRAAQAAGDASDDDRALELARYAAELSDWMAQLQDETADEATEAQSLDADDSAVEVDASDLVETRGPSMIPADIDVDASEAPPAIELNAPESPGGGDDEATEVRRPASEHRDDAASVLPAETVHAGMFNPWAGGETAAKRNSQPPPPVIGPDDDDEEVVTSVRPHALAAARDAAPISVVPISAVPISVASVLPVAPPIAPVRATPPKPPPPVPKAPPPPLPPRARTAPPPQGAQPLPGAAPGPQAPSAPRPAGPPRPTAGSPQPPRAAPRPAAPEPSIIEPLSQEYTAVPAAMPDLAAPRDESTIEPMSRDFSVTDPSQIEAPLIEPSILDDVLMERPDPTEAETLDAPPVAEKPAAQEPVASAGELDLDSVEAFSDLPDDARSDFAAAATIHHLNEGEEIGTFALAYVLSGKFDVAATMVDAPAVRLDTGAVLRARGSTEEGVPMRLICAQGKGVVATWSDEAVEAAFRTCPWVEEDLRTAADRVQTLVGITIGPLGERLDVSIRELIVGKLTMRTLIPGDVVVEAGAPVPGLLLVGIGDLELVKDDKVVGGVSSGDFLFATEVLGAGSAPATARAGSGGALVLFGDRNVAQELLVTCPPLLEVFAGM